LKNLTKQAVFLCGGLGTRLKPLTDHVPKPMVDVNGKPFLWHLLEQLAEKGINRFVLLTGYLGHTISDYFGNGEKWGWEIVYSYGPAEWDTGRRLWEAREFLDPEFLLAYSDNFLQIRLDLLVEAWGRTKASMAVHLAPKMDGNIRLGDDGLIHEYDPSRKAPGLDFVEVGYMLCRKDEVLHYLERLEGFPDISFSKVLKVVASEGKLAGIVINDPYQSIGDLERLEKTRFYLSPKKIILIDRDGTINRKAPRGEYIRTWDEFEFLPETRRAMKELAQAGYQFIVITNQAGVARGMIDSSKLEEIHQNMVGALKNEGVDILNVYVCPDHWETNSFRRKPNPGMFFEASRDFGLRLDRTIYIGDDIRDCEAAFYAGTRCIYVGDMAEIIKLQIKHKPIYDFNYIPSPSEMDRLVFKA
jgi:histidinol-phosphate phosphatase family protein